MHEGGNAWPWVRWAHRLINPYYTEVLNHGVPEAWLGGLIYVEDESLNPRASRFEKHIWEELNLVREGGHSQAFPGFNQDPIKTFVQTCCKDSVVYLASSYGLGQIMGFNYFITYGLHPNKFTDLTFKESVEYTLDRMGAGIHQHAIGTDYEKLLRWWNTGSPSGQTFDPHYVEKATKAKDLYEGIRLFRADEKTV